MTMKNIREKIMLILFSEVLVVLLTNLISMYVYPLHYPVLSYIVCGGVLAYVVVYLHDYYKRKRRERIRQELESLNDAALMRYNVDDKDQ